MQNAKVRASLIVSLAMPAPMALLAMLVSLLVSLGGCATQHHEPPRIEQPLTPAEALATPDPIPQVEPPAALGNPPFYDVFGKRYYVLASAAGYVERGVASWYGPGFHKERTATGDRYDMYGMTAAHKTLPLPCYARVTNLSNGRSVIVHINDRGPFKDDRIIDLSYTAATKLDMIRAGTALVEVQVIGADGSAVPSTPNVTSSISGSLYVQAGAFKDEENAKRLVERLRALGYANATVTAEDRLPRDLHRVRIGPIASVDEFDRIVQHLRTLGIDDARLAAVDR